MMDDYGRKMLREVTEVAEAHFEIAMREKDEEKLTKLGLILDGLATVNPDRETFEAMFDRVVRPHLPIVPSPPAAPDEFDDDVPF
jgi:hypothetical protein